MLGLSIAILVIELVGGFASNSLALLADAGHVFTDVAGLSLALLAIWFGSRPTSSERTFGYLRLEILAAVVNAVVLFGIAALVLFAAFHYRQGLAGIFLALILGAVLTGFYLWKRNLTANMFGHFLVDFVPNVVLPLFGAVD